MNTYYAENKMLDQLFGSTAIGVPANWYIGLSTTTPTESGTNITEPSGGGYARVEVLNDKATNFNNAVSGSLTNKAEFLFPESTAVWGDITHIVFFDAPTNGNAWFYQALPAPQWVGIYTTVSLGNGLLTISNKNT